jgi:hypothetical protein
MMLSAGSLIVAAFPRQVEPSHWWIVRTAGRRYRPSSSEKESSMLRRVFAVTLAAASIVAVVAPPVAAQYLQAAPSQPEKKLTPQQQKLKDCGAKWQEMKKNGTAKDTTWAAYRKACMRAPA